MRPQSYARALWHAAAELPATPEQQAILLRVSATVMAESLRLAFAAACTRLEAARVKPGMYRTVVIASNAGRDTGPTVDVTLPGALDGLLHSMPTDAASSAEARPAGRRKRSAPNPALEEALRQVEELPRRMPAAGANGVGADTDIAHDGGASADAPLLLAHRGTLMATAVEIVDRQIIELLARLFETILVDPGLPAACSALIGRLQVPALRIALLDPSLLDAHDHPVWVLLDRIVMTSASYPQPNDPRLAELLRFCTSLIQHMTSEPVQDSALYRHSLARLDAFLDEQLRRQQREAQPAIDALAHAVQAEQLQRNLSGRLAMQMRSIQATPVIQRFVTATWAHVLAESLLRFGDQAEPTVGFLKVVDDLLWTLRLPDHPQSRQRLLGLLPGLLQRLRAGMALIAWPAADQQILLGELMKLHSEALRPGARPAMPSVAEAETPAGIVKRLREETVPHAADPPPFSDSLIDLASMDTVPAELMDRAADPQANDPAD